MSRIQSDADICIKSYIAQRDQLKHVILEHGLPIRMFIGQNSTLWRFDDGYEFTVNDFR